MNKKLITLAVAAAMVAPLAVAAETTLYGRIDTAVVYGDPDGEDDGGRWDVDTSSTRIGVKGSEDLGSGLKAIFQAEWEFTSSEGHGSTAGDDRTDSSDNSRADLGFDNRLAYAGLQGGFGTVTIGRQWTNYYGAVNKSNVFNDPAGNNSAGGVGNIASANKNSLGPSRLGNQLMYTSPDFNGFKGQLSLVMDRELGGDDSDGIDAYIPSVSYENGPISIGLAAVEYDDDINDLEKANGGQNDLWGIAGSYNFGMFKLIAQYEDKDDLDAAGDKSGADSWALVGEAYFGNNIVRATYGEVDYNNDDDMDVYAISFQHNFSKRTRVYAEYAVNDTDSDDAGRDADKDQFSLGLRHDF